ncbi:MAG: hypothetical protein JSW10_04840 [Pseudomonadota bacterium]|nr:MAG: hypothetical protein JSW10_04840 [Pseudomonadota bacterium]
MLQLPAYPPRIAQVGRATIGLTRTALLALSVSLAGCENPENETVDPLTFEYELFGVTVNYFDAYAALTNPSMDGKGCTNVFCHGIGAAGEAAPGKSLQLFPNVTVDRSVQMANNYISALSNVSIGDANASLLLAKPLGALSHVGGTLWDATESEYRAAAAWAKQNVPDSSALDFASFPANINLLFISRGCANAGCHRKGESNAAVGGFFLDRDAVAGDQTMIFNYLWALANVDLTNPAQSKLLTKPLDEGAGGESHGGGAIFADTTDAGYIALLNWIQNPVPAPR